MKATGVFPNNQLPVVVHKGKYYNESVAMLRFVGKHFGYYPENLNEAW